MKYFAGDFVQQCTLIIHTFQSITTVDVFLGHFYELIDKEMFLQMLFATVGL